MRTVALSQRERLRYTTVHPDIFPQKTNCASRHHTSWCSGILTEKGWSSDFPPLPSAFSDNSSMAFMLRSHNGVHCCGTVGDSHPSSQLIAAKRTFTGDSFQNHSARTVQTKSHYARLNGRGATRSRKFVCKDSAIFRFSEENTNKFAFLSVKSYLNRVEKQILI